MKKIITSSIFTLISLLFSISVMAQNGYKQSVGKRTLNFKDSTVFVLEVDRAIEKDVVTAWKKAIEKNKIKARIENDQLAIEQVIIESVDEKPIDIYSTVVQQDHSVKLYTVFMVDGLRVDPHGKEGAAVKIRKLLGNFGAKVYKEVLERELKEKQAKLVDFEKSRNKVLKEQDKLIKAIQKDSLNIGSEETEISLLKGQLEGATDRYNTQKNKVASTKFESKEEAKEAKDELKGYDKERKSIEKEIEKHHNEILDLKSEIRDYEYELEQLIKDEVLLQQKALDQRDLVKRAQEELE